MPKVLLLSRQPLTQRPLQNWLDDTARTIMLITPKSAVAGAEDVLAQHFPNHRLVDDYYSWSTMRIAEQAARSFGAELVASTSEQDVLRAARLRERLGSTGQSGDSATAYRDKVTMKRLARAAGVAVPAFAPIDDPMDLLDFIDAHGFPVVTKPRSEAGANGVRMLHNPRDVAEFLGRPAADPPYLPGQWMVETFVHGEFCHVDGIMRDGRIVHGWPSRYSEGIAEYLRDGSCLSSALLAPEDPRRTRLMELTAEVIAALPAAPLPLAFHCEAWIVPDGRPVLCEIACRAGGALIPRAYERAFGVQLSKEALRAQCGSALTLSHQPSVPGPASGWLVLAPQPGRFAPPVERCPVPGAELAICMAAGTNSVGLSQVDDVAANAVVSAETAAGVRERIDLAVHWWRERATWTR
jgi:biotin carboxylase